jgi:malonyl CoA-acyl carrier protein transacylase
MKDTAHRAVAVVGLGAILPDAPNSGQFWENIKSGRYSISEVEAGRWDPDLYFDSDPKAPDKTYSKIGGWVRDWEWKPFDWKLPIPPKVASAMDDAQRWGINITKSVLDDFGYPERPLDEDRTAVIIGNAMAGEKHYLSALRISFPEFARELELAESFAELPADVRHRVIAQTRDRMNLLIPDITEDSMPGELANVMAGRIANVFNFHGPNFVCDAACASAMAAINAAVEGLTEHDFDAVITGGIDRNMSAHTYVKFCKIGALSASGTRPYANGADGFVMGEGASLFLMKRLADAERDGDHIYAVLRGMGGSSDGKGKGITAPNPIGQKLAIQRAWENAGLSPATAGFIEGHGTSTRVGDAVEVESLNSVFNSAGAAPGSIALGSVKSNFGHLKAAAGAAGILKTVLALNDKVIPPSLNCEDPNPAIDFKHSPFYVNGDLREWEKPDCGARRAAVSAFGFGGTNFHAVFEEYIPGRLNGGGRKYHSVRTSMDQSSTATLAASGGAASPKAPRGGVAMIGAGNAVELSQRLRTLKGDAEAGRVKTGEAPLIRDIEALARMAIDFTDPADLSRKIDLASTAIQRDDAGLWKALTAQGIFRGQGEPGKVAFLFPGQGSQYINMLADLRETEPLVRETFEQADRVMEPILGKPLSEYVFVDSEDPERIKQANRALMQTEITQPALIACDIALSRLLGAYGIAPDLVMGHSLGEYGALVQAGAISFADALEAVAARGREMSRVSMGDNGKMAAVFAPLTDVQRLLARVEGYAVIANINSYQQSVIGGETASIDQALEMFAEEGVQVVPLPVSHAFHTRIVAPASAPLRKVLSRMHLRAPGIPTICNVSGEFYPRGEDAVEDMLDLLARQIASPVQFIKGLESLYDEGARVFVEVGPKKALKGLVDGVLGDRADVVSLFSNHPKVGGHVSFSQVLCGLYASGHGAGREEPAPAPVTHQTPKSDQAPAVSPPPGAQADLDNEFPNVPPDASQYGELGDLVRKFVQRGSQLISARTSDNGGIDGKIVVSGAALGLPGTARLFDDENVEKILHGEQFIDVIPYRLRQAMAGKHITRLVKPENGDPVFKTIDSTSDVIKLAGRAGAFDIVDEYGIRAERAKAFDITTAMAIAVGIDALRDAGIPLVLAYKTTTTGTRLPDRWRLSEQMRDDTGIIFASAFPGSDALAEQLSEYYTESGHREQLAGLESLRDWLDHQANGQRAGIDELDRRIAELKSLIGRTAYRFDRRFLFRCLSMGHSQFAEEIGARGPNTQINGACASTTQAVSIAEDWIQRGRCRRVIIVSADNVTSDNLVEWIGSGFLASGAAATDENVEDAATPFDRRRHGMIMGMGAAALVVESEDSVQERGLQAICEVLGSVAVNSAFHGTRLDIEHIASVMEKLVCDVEKRHGISRDQMAPRMLFMSHETYTPARGGSASAEIHALRSVFGEKADQIVITNTKGFTGHAMAAGIEDVVAVKALETGIVPPVPNFREVDPELGQLNLSTGGAYPVQYALRLGAGFGSQLAMTLTRWLPSPDGRRRNADQLGFDYRIFDETAWSRWLGRISGYEAAGLEVEHRRLRIQDQGPPRVDSLAPAAGTSAPEPVAPRPVPLPEVSATAVSQQPSEAVSSGLEPVAPPVAAPGAPAPEAITEPPAPASAGDGVEEAVIKLVSEKTDYPPDMLDLDLDLEADLGVDTVKQAEVFAEVRETYNIERDDDLQMREFPTLAHVVQFVRDRAPDLPATEAVAAHATPPAPPVPKDRSTPATTAMPDAEITGDSDGVEEAVIRLVAEKTDYPPDMLDLDLDMEADLGVDTVKQAEVFAEVRQSYDIPRDDKLQMREFPTLAHVIQFVRDRAPGLAGASEAPKPPLAPVEPAATAADDSSIAEKVLEIVAGMTGYPPDMLDMELDLEADLGIDTVKQAEIFAALRGAYDIPRDDQLQLKDFPTLNHAVGFVTDRLPKSEPEPEQSGIVTQTPEEDASAPEAPAGESARELEDELKAGGISAANQVPRRVPMAMWRPSVDLFKSSGVELAKGSRIIVMPDSGGVATALIKRLEKRGIKVLVLDRQTDNDALEELLKDWTSADPVQGVYWLPALDAHAPLATLGHDDWREAARIRVKLLYTVMRFINDRLADEGSFLIAATRQGGKHGYDPHGALNPIGGGVTGFVKAFKRERPEILCKALDFAESRKTAALADRIIEETLRDPGAVEIGFQDGERWAIGFDVIPCDDSETGIELGKDTVFLVTGAAGSIVSAIIADLAEASGGTFHLLDLAPEPDRSDPDIARFVNDREGLKRDLFERIKSGGKRATPALVEKELTRLERAQAAASAIEAVERCGGKAVYHCVDLGDDAAVRAAVDSIRNDDGVVDVLIHAGGLEISRFLADKSPREFDLVFDVKCNGWHSLLHAMEDMPLKAAVVFSSVAGRFGNGGQTDYSAANDLLCKSISSFRNSRPETLAIAIDWTAWGGIGMATRGSIPTMMKAAGISLLPPESGIPTVRRELTCGPAVGEIIVAGELGMLTSEWDSTGGLDTDAVKLNGHGPMIGSIAGMGLYEGLAIETRLDPSDQAFLYDHKIDGTAVLPGVMGLEGFAELSTLLLPGWRVEAIEDVRFLEPFKFYRDEPRNLKLTAQLTANGKGMQARCRLISERVLKGKPEPVVTTAFQAKVRLNQDSAEILSGDKPAAADGPVLDAEDVYRVYFHGPAYRVLSSAWGDGPGTVIGRLADDLPPNHEPESLPTQMAPRLIELCFQTAGMYELGVDGRYGLPSRISRLQKLGEISPDDKPFYSIVRHSASGSGFDADIVDQGGQVYMRLSDYRTAELPGAAGALETGPIKAVFNTRQE